MSKRTPITVDLADYRASKEDEGAILIHSDGETFRVPPPVLWPDEALERAKAEDNVGLSKALLGEEAYARFTAAGGTSALLLDIIKSNLGVPAGE